jgi:hypothetical protein
VVQVEDLAQVEVVNCMVVAVVVQETVPQVELAVLALYVLFGDAIVCSHLQERVISKWLI